MQIYTNTRARTHTRRRVDYFTPCQQLRLYHGQEGNREHPAIFPLHVSRKLLSVLSTHSDHAKAEQKLQIGKLIHTCEKWATEGTTPRVQVRHLVTLLDNTININ